jgi:hypothetical protein
MESVTLGNTDTDARLAHRLRQLRIERSWSLEELATKSGVESDLPALVPRQAQPVWIDPETGFHRQPGDSVADRK